VYRFDVQEKKKITLVKNKLKSEMFLYLAHRPKKQLFLQKANGIF